MHSLFYMKIDLQYIVFGFVWPLIKKTDPDSPRIDIEWSQAKGLCLAQRARPGRYDVEPNWSLDVVASSHLNHRR